MFISKTHIINSDILIPVPDKKLWPTAYVNIHPKMLRFLFLMYSVLNNISIKKLLYKFWEDDLLDLGQNVSYVGPPYL